VSHNGIEIISLIFKVSFSYAYQNISYNSRICHANIIIFYFLLPMALTLRYLLGLGLDFLKIF